MIPIVEKAIESCDTKDALSEVGLLAGLAVAIYGAYKYVKSVEPEMKNSGILAATAGGIFMIGSFNLRNTTCKYRYE